MFNKILSALGVVAIMTITLDIDAATLTYSGQITSATGAFSALTPNGTLVAGEIDVADGALAAGSIGISDINDIGISVGGFCFTFGFGTCAGTTVPITSIDSANITGTTGTLGGSLSVNTFSSTFQLSIPIVFDLDAGSFSASADMLGTIFGPGTLEAPSQVPVPAAIWLFGSAVLCTIGIRRRAETRLC